MGTSKSYKATVSGQPQWGDLSRSLTTNCDGGTVSQDNLQKILGRFVSVIGGARRAGGGRSRVAGRSGARSAKNIGSFLGGFSSSGGNLTEALELIGFTDLTGKTTEDIINHLIEYCSGPSSTIDDAAAKQATRQLLEELSSNAETIEEFERTLREVLERDSIEDIVIKYFGFYIMEHLSQMFYEKLVEAKGKTECSNLFNQIKHFIRARLNQMSKNNPLNGVDWGSEEAEAIIKTIQVDVLNVFENEN